ncbi:hypothetical protein [Streptomyces swartbergensis]|uniref:hypothetical protein n=1 Tax=Streptomyces swartbergensis TaxID=487165 RepID=UPI003820FC98
MAEKVAEAARRERETRQQLDVPAIREPYARDPEELAELWAAKHTEWRRIAALLETTGQEAYDPAPDAQGTAWAQEREARRQAAVGRHAAWVKERQDAKAELRAQPTCRVRSGPASSLSPFTPLCTGILNLCGARCPARDWTRSHRLRPGARADATD